MSSLGSEPVKTKTMPLRRYRKHTYRHLGMRPCAVAAFVVAQESCLSYSTNGPIHKIFTSAFSYGHVRVALDRACFGVRRTCFWTGFLPFLPSLLLSFSCLCLFSLLSSKVTRQRQDNIPATSPGPSPFTMLEIKLLRLRGTPVSRLSSMRERAT